MARRSKRLPDPEGSIAFTVEEMCKAEIDAAIDSFVLSRNLIASHVLASAAHDVMRGHASRVGASLRADLSANMARLSSHQNKIVLDTMAHFYNSMKHSNSNEVAVTIHPTIVESTIYCAAQEHGWLFKKLSARMVTFIAWFTVVKPALLDENGNKPSVLVNAFPSALLQAPRSEQMKELKQAIAKIMEDSGGPEQSQDAFDVSDLWSPADGG